MFKSCSAERSEDQVRKGEKGVGNFRVMSLIGVAITGLRNTYMTWVWGQAGPGTKIVKLWILFK